ncbi:Uncharacterized protein APZ42_021070 [Daphnia magna]|uniref:Uncharacterized protein n=1 Tax=Daphnia magna TaxID=35525 RepID=A0A164WY59_9CRUS|nr:Uncharacterized protein APZ42_021070 [Daphnia magna]
MSIKQRSVSSWITLAKVRSHRQKVMPSPAVHLIPFISFNVHQVYHRLLYSAKQLLVLISSCNYTH